MNEEKKYNIAVCVSGSCRRNFAEDTLKCIEKKLMIKAGESTPGGKFTLEKTGCMGFCSYSPCVIINDKIHTNILPREMRELLENIDTTD